jgi:hypothetical protein
MGLQPLELARVFVNALIVELPHCAENFVEVRRVRAVVAQLFAETLRLSSPVARLIAKIANFSWRINSLTPP